MRNLIFLLVTFSLLILVVGCDKHEPTKPPFNTDPPEYGSGGVDFKIQLQSAGSEVNGELEMYVFYPEDETYRLYKSFDFQGNGGNHFLATVSDTNSFGDYDLLFKADGHVWYYHFGFKVNPDRTTFLEVTLSDDFFAGEEAVSYAASEDENSRGNCQNCHGSMVAEWLESGHSSDPDLVLSTIYGENGGNYQNDENCLGCHAPQPIFLLTDNIEDLIAERPPHRTSGFPQHGVNCVTCHVVRVDPREGIENDSLGYAGPFDYSSDGFLALEENTVNHRFEAESYIQESVLCAVCHQYGGGETHEYENQNTYAEWQEYASAGGEESCQSCHMGTVVSLELPVASIERSLAPNRPARLIREHTFLSHESIELLMAGLSISFTQDPNSEINFTDEFNFRIKLENTSAGHDYPTGNFDRQLRLVFSLRDVQFGDEITLSRNGGTYEPLGAVGTSEASREIDVVAPGSIGDPPPEEEPYNGSEVRVLKVDVYYDPSNLLDLEDEAQEEIFTGDQTLVLSLSYPITVNN